MDLGDNRCGFALAQPEAQFGLALTWVRFAKLNDGHSAVRFLKLINPDGDVRSIGILPSGELFNDYRWANSTNTGMFLVPNTWYCMLLGWKYDPATTAIDTVTKIGTLDDVLNGRGLPNVLVIAEQLVWNPPTSVEFGCPSAGSHYWGRFSAPSVYSATSWDDLDLPADLLLPTTNRAIWYVNPATGNDQNDGASPERAWASSGKLAKMLHFGGIMGTPIPWRWASNNAAVGQIPDAAFMTNVMAGNIVAGGDKILIDTSGSPLAVTNSLQFLEGNSGVELCGANGQAYLDCTKEISTWIPYSNSVYYTTDTEPHVTLWEGWKWLNAPAGISFDAVTEMILNTPGSYYNTGERIYFHPFESAGFPRSEVTYRRSRRLPGYDGLARPPLEVNWEVSGIHIHHIKCGGSALIDPTDGRMVDTEVLYNGAGNWSVIGHCDLFASSKHIYGGIHRGTNWACLVHDTTVRQCPPGSEAGGKASAVVDFTTSTTADDARCYYIRTDWSEAGVIGSANGTNHGLYFCHPGTTGTQQFSVLSMTECSGAISIAFVLTNILIEGGSHRFVELAGSRAVITRCDISEAVYGTAGGTLQDSLLRFRRIDAGYGRKWPGNWTFVGNTFDARNMPNVNYSSEGYGLLGQTPLSSWVVSNNVFLISAAGQFPFSLVAGTTNTFDRNLYQLGTNQIVARFDGKAANGFTEWQALGHDRFGISAEARLDENHRPLADSPVRKLGLNLGRMQDLSGRWFANRRSAGAYEWWGVVLELNVSSIEGANLRFRHSDDILLSDLNRLELQWRTVLPHGLPGDWNSVNAVFQVLNGFVEVRDGSAAGQPARFYRIVEY